VGTVVAGAGHFLGQSGHRAGRLGLHCLSVESDQHRLHGHAICPVLLPDDSAGQVYRRLFRHDCRSLRLRRVLRSDGAGRHAGHCAGCLAAPLSCRTPTTDEGQLTMHKQCLYLTTALMAAATVPLSVATANATQADAVTLHHNGPAVVQQSRAITLHAGLQQLAWPVYAPAVVAESLWLSGDGVTLAGAAVPKIDDSTPAALLAGREGQTVTLLSTDSDAK